MARLRGAPPLRLLSAFVLVATLIGPAPAQAATDLIPGLRMDPLSNFYTESSGGQRRLRFGTVMTNLGTGPLEVLGSRSSSDEPHLRTQQRIYVDTGGNYVTDSRALMEYAADGHDHWHIQGVMLYQLWSDDGQTRRGTKVGFCFLDSVRRGSTGASVYRESMCGTAGVLGNRMGLSVGWGDDYPANFAFQWIDISPLRPGEYVVQARADEQNWYVELDESNNCAWARVYIDAVNGPVQVLAQGQGACLTPPASTALVERQYGDDRYQTAATVSEDGFAPPVPVAYVATGENCPDALAAGPIAALRGAPTLLVRVSSIPEPSAAELDRLNLGRIVLLAGPGVIGMVVQDALQAYTGG